MSDLHTFRAATIHEALALVRRELGADAYVLDTRQVRVASAPGQPVRVVTEIDASLSPRAARRPVGKAASMADTLATTERPAMPLRSNDATARPQDLRRWTPRTEPVAGSPTTIPSASAITGRRATPASDAATAQRPSAIDGTSTAPLIAPQFDQRMARLEDQLSQVARALPRLSTAPQSTLSPVLQLAWDRMEQVGLAGGLAMELLEQLKRLEPAQRSGVSEQVPWDILCEGLERRLSVAPLTPAGRGRRQVTAFVGPTGVGKTTTIAKLAARYSLRQGLRVALVTVDTYRIAAVEQLRTYAEIIGCPLEVVSTPAEMRAALGRQSDQDVVLIDTAGRGPFDAEKIEELTAILAAAEPSEIHLVLSFAGSPQRLNSVIDRFRVVRPTRLLATKLDECDALGPLVDAIDRAGAPLSYLTTGQDVPDDIEPAQARRLAHLILKCESAHTASRQISDKREVARA